MNSPTLTSAGSKRAGEEHRVILRQLREEDLPHADRILRDAFDSFTGVPNLFGTRDYARTRWSANPEAALAAELDGALVGSNFVTGWGTLGFFGPLSVRPDLWDKGIAKAMMEATLDMFEALGTKRQALFTFPSSPKHIGLYQKFGFWPQYLAPILSRALEPGALGAAHAPGVRYSELSSSDRGAYEDAARELTGSLHPGLDLEREIRSVHNQGIGDTMFLAGDRLDGVAVCHIGAGSEAGAESCYVKFGVVRSGSRSRLEFDRLMAACGELALRRGANRIEIGVSTACRGPYEALLAHGFRAGMIGVTMERPEGITYHRPDSWVMSDWR